MSKGPPFFALEIFSDAVDELAVGKGDVRRRLVKAYRKLWVLQAEDAVPEEIKEDYDWIMTKLTEKERFPWDNNPNVGELQATLMRMKNKTGSKIARRIVEVYHQLDALCYRPVQESDP